MNNENRLTTFFLCSYSSWFQFALFPWETQMEICLHIFWKQKQTYLSPPQFSFIHKKECLSIPSLRAFPCYIKKKKSGFFFSPTRNLHFKWNFLEKQKFPCKFRGTWRESRQGKGTVICAEWWPTSLQKRRKITAKARMHAEICWPSRKVFADGGNVGEHKA